MPQPEVFQNLRLRFPHAGFLVRFGVVVTEEMQNAVDNEQARLVGEGMTSGAGLRVGAGDRKEDIAQITRARFRVRFGGGEGEHIRRRVDD